MSRRGELATAVRRALITAAAALVRDLHGHGCLHADLTPSNILVNRSALAGAPVRAWILDLDRARLCASLSSAERRANLRRIYRFVDRRERGARPALSRADRARFLRVYAPEAWRDHWRAIEAAHRRSLRWHAFGWLAERVFNRARDVREEPGAGGAG
jgi:hypothetical protein